MRSSPSRFSLRAVAGVIQSALLRAGPLGVLRTRPAGPVLGRNWILVPSQPLAHRRVDVVPQFDEVLDEDCRKTFVELETHHTGGAVGTGRALRR
jgi:hypothetical protein